MREGALFGAGDVKSVLDKKEMPCSAETVMRNPSANESLSSYMVNLETVRKEMH